MPVKLTRDLRCVPEGQVYPRTFRAGAIVGGTVAEAALAQKAGIEIAAEVQRAPETRTAGGSDGGNAGGNTGAPAPQAPGSAPPVATTAEPPATPAPSVQPPQPAAEDPPAQRAKRKPQA